MGNRCGEEGGGCCAAHLLTKVTEYLRQSKDNKVTVERIYPTTLIDKCDYCSASAEYAVSYFG